MKFFKWGAPFLVSALLLAWIFADIDFDRILAKPIGEHARHSFLHIGLPKPLVNYTW